MHQLYDLMLPNQQQNEKKTDINNNDENDLSEKLMENNIIPFLGDPDKTNSNTSLYQQLRPLNNDNNHVALQYVPKS